MTSPLSQAAHSIQIIILQLKMERFSVTDSWIRNPLGEFLLTWVKIFGKTLHFKACCASPRRLKILTDEHGWGLDSGSIQQKCENQVISDFTLEPLPLGHISLQKLGGTFQGALWALSRSRAWAIPTLFRLRFKPSFAFRVIMAQTQQCFVSLMCYLLHFFMCISSECLLSILHNIFVWLGALLIMEVQ